MTGRPTICTPEVIEAVREALDLGMMRMHAQDAAGISESTWDNWCRRGETGEEPFVAFLATVRAGRSSGIKRNLKVIRDAAPDDWKAAAWVMERSHGYYKRERVLHENQPAAATPEQTMTDAEVAEAVEAELATFPVEVLAMALAEAQRRNGEVGEAK